MSHISEPLLHSYVDGECNAASRAAVESHLATCDDCQDRLDAVRRVAAQASSLIGSVEPGPVHAPAFEELQARAASRAETVDSIDGPSAEPTDASAFDQSGGGSTSTEETSRTAVTTPLWRRPALAWAASLAMAFALGWMSGIEIGPPQELVSSESAPTQESADAPAAAQAAAELGRAEEREADDTLDLTAAVAKRSIAANAPAESSAIDQARLSGNRVATELGAEVADPASPPVATPQAAEPEVSRVIAASPVVEAEERQTVRADPSSIQEANLRADFRETSPESLLGRSSVGAIAGEFLRIPDEDAGAWLGTEPRRIPELELLRTEVGHGGLVAGGEPGRVTIRQVYGHESGEEIVLLQQYVGPVADIDPASAVDRRNVARDTAVGERPRAASPARAGRAELADADVAKPAIDGLVMSSEPGRLLAYRWREADLFVLSLSGRVDAAILRELIERIR